MAEWAATVIQKNWRAYKARKNLKKSESPARKSFIETDDVDPFKIFVSKQKRVKKSRAVGTYNYHAERICIQCDEEVVKRQCMICEDNMFCVKCFASTHTIGPAKRHFYFDVTYYRT